MFFCFLFQLFNEDFNPVSPVYFLCLLFYVLCCVFFLNSMQLSSVYPVAGASN